MTFSQVPALFFFCHSYTQMNHLKFKKQGNASVSEREEEAVWPCCRIQPVSAAHLAVFQSVPLIPFCSGFPNFWKELGIINVILQLFSISLPIPVSEVAQPFLFERSALSFSVQVPPWVPLWKKKPRCYFFWLPSCEGRPIETSSLKVQRIPTPPYYTTSLLQNSK